MTKTKRCCGKKGQIFSLDVLIALSVVLIILGTALQYLNNAELKISDTVRDYDNQIVATNMLDYFVDSDNHRLFDCEDEPELKVYDGTFDSEFRTDPILYVANTGGACTKDYEACEIADNVSSAAPKRFMYYKTDTEFYILTTTLQVWRIPNYEVSHSP